MKKTNVYYIGIAALLLGVPTTAWTQESSEAVLGIGVRGAGVKRNAEVMSVTLEMDLGGLELGGDRASLFVPVLRNGEDSLELPCVGVYGRTRWYQYLRAGEPLGGADETSVRWSERPSTYPYRLDVPYAGWMNGSELLLRRRDYGCCRTLLGERGLALAGYREVEYEPEFRYLRPVATGVKHRELSGHAYIDFPVNRTEINPEYRRNPEELRKIIGTIDSIRTDRDVTVSSITIKGYASPEGSYSNNERLAKGRTRTLKEYVEGMYGFGPGFIRTEYEPEDWAGLRRYVEGSDLPHRAEILSLIDGDLEADAKEARIRRTYPEEYRYLLQTVYPGLRHSDYTIEYTIREYTDVGEIAELLRTSPQKLSLDEMFLLAQSLEPGSEEYDEVFETSVRMYPEDETANLNAANAAMGRRDLKGAEKYLAKAGASAEAEYARGVLKALEGDFEGAESQVEKARGLGMEDTEGVLAHMEEARKYAPVRSAAEDDAALPLEETGQDN